MPLQLLPHMFHVAYGMFVVTGSKNNDDDASGAKVWEELKEEAASDDDDEEEDGNSKVEEEEQKKEEDSSDSDNAFEKRLKARIKGTTREDDGLLATEIFFFRMFVFDVTDKDESFKWKNTGDVVRLLQDQKMIEFHSDLISLMPREMLPCVFMINDDNGKELKFKARLSGILGVDSSVHISSVSKFLN